MLTIFLLFWILAACFDQFVRFNNKSQTQSANTRITIVGQSIQYVNAHTRTHTHLRTHIWAFRMQSNNKMYSTI